MVLTGMKKISVLIALGMLMIAPWGMAQTIYDGAKLTGKDLNGTARFVGMGGAMGALGGDISTMGTNPAGIGLYRSNDVMTSFGLSLYGNESQYLGKKFNSDLTKGDFNNIGFVFSSKIGNETPLRFVNFGFNYHKAKSFNNNMRMEGNLGLYSQTYLMASQAAGIEKWGDSPYTDNGIGWLSILGADAGLIRDITIHDKTGGVNNIPYTYKDEQGKEVQYKDINGNPLYISPGHFEGMLDNGYANFRSEERGGIDQYDFNVSFNFNDRVYLGLTVGAYDVDYSKYSSYDESYGEETGYLLESWNKISGSGFDFKMGAIVRPFESSPFRIGASVHSPTFYKLTLTTSARLISDMYLDGKLKRTDIDTYNLVGDMNREYSLRTPWIYNLSLGYTVGNSFAIGAEYEYEDYSTMRFNYPEGDAMFFENNQTDMLKGVHTFRVGAEYKVIPQFAFRLGYNHSTTAFKGEAYKQLPENSISTDTDFANAQALNNYTLGIGYRGNMFYADLAYKFSSYKEDFYAFDDLYLNKTEVTNTRSQVLFTVGMRF